MGEQLSLQLHALTAAPVAREAISIWWEKPEPAPLTPDERNEWLARDLRRQEDIARWYRNREKAIVDELIFLRSYIQAVAEGKATFMHHYTRWQRTDPERDAKGIWRYVLASAEANRVLEDSIMGPHRPAPTEAEPPPHDIREFDWAECHVYRHAAAGSWRIGWRGGDVCVFAPHPTDSLLPGFWDILTFPSKAKAFARLERYRADVEVVRREWRDLMDGKSA